MKYGFYFRILAALMLSIAIRFGGWCNTLIYPSFSFAIVAIVAIGYLGAGPRVFGKQSNGKRSLIATVVLFPYLMFTQATWHLIRLISREPAIDQVNADLYVSRRLLKGELPKMVNSVVDLTCEFTDPKFECGYLCFPVLDASCPSVEDLNELARRITELPKPVLIHCAQGHGRTGLVASAILVSSGKASTTTEALALVKRARPKIELNALQRKTLLLLSQLRKDE